MSPERAYPETARQTFDISRWIDSELGEMTTAIALAELIDNILDETPSGKKAVVKIIIDERTNELTIEQRNTVGMTPEKMKEYPKWGGLRTDPNKMREHSLGGKLAVLFLIKKEEGGAQIISHPPGSEVSYRMNLGNWWKKLSPDEKFRIETIGGNKEDLAGSTIIHLTGLEMSHFKNIWETAEHLGLAYGQLIANQRVEITIERQLQHGKLFENKTVLPIRIPFREGQVTSKRSVLAGKAKDGPQIDISWGLIDSDQRKREETTRRNVYGIKAITSVHGDRIYFYYYGRLLSALPLASFRIPGYTSRMAFEAFAVSVDITKGWVSKTILKTGFRAASPVTQDIINKVIYFIKDEIAQLGTESRGVELPRQFQTKAAEASSILSSVLARLFDNNISLIAQTFNLPYVTETARSSAEPNREKTEERVGNKGRKISLPGTREPITGTRTVERSWVDPIPKFVLVTLGTKSPAAQLTLDSGGKPQIETNCSNPDVFATLQQRGKDGLRGLLRIGATALFTEKWLQREPRNSAGFSKGVEQDVAEFLSMALELKEI